VKIAQIANLLDSLLAGLDGVLAAAPTKDLKSFREGMRPFGERTVGDFMAFLSKCEEYERTGVVSGTTRGGGKKPGAAKKADDPQQLDDAITLARTVLNDINEGRVDGQRIEGALAIFTNLSKPQLDQLLVELKIAGKARSKPAAIDKIRQILKSQAEMYVKTHSGL
jgi:hypothetical protein